MRYKRQYKSQDPAQNGQRRGARKASPEGGLPDTELQPVERTVSAVVQVLTGGILLFIFLWIVWLA
jgi:hypothetical protein